MLNWLFGFIAGLIIGMWLFYLIWYRPKMRIKKVDKFNSVITVAKERGLKAGDCLEVKL